jgi:hypothetical protein
MAAPNIVSVIDIRGKSNVANITTVSSSVIVNAVNSGKVFKINTLIVSNVDGTNAGNVSVELFKFGAQNTSTGSGNATYAIANTVTVPARSSLDILSKSLYLEEGDQIKVKGDANNRLHFISSFEEIS